MIISGGENVFPQEVEDCLARHEAFVVLTSADAADESELKDHVQSSLARYNVPREFVFLDKLPHNVTGKILKRELLDHEAAR